MIFNNKNYYHGFIQNRIVSILWIITGLYVLLFTDNEFFSGLLLTLISLMVFLIALLNKKRFKIVGLDDEAVAIVDGPNETRRLEWSDVKRISRRLTPTPTYRLILRDSDEDIVFYSDWGQQKTTQGKFYPTFNWHNRMGGIIKRKRKELKW